MSAGKNNGRLEGSTEFQQSATGRVKRGKRNVYQGYITYIWENPDVSMNKLGERFALSDMPCKVPKISDFIINITLLTLSLFEICKREWYNSVDQAKKRGGFLWRAVFYCWKMRRA